MGPEAAEIDVGLWHAHVGEEEPGSEDRLGKDVQDCVGDDLLVDAHVAGAIGDTPDTVKKVVSIMWDTRSVLRRCYDLHWVDSPDDDGETSNGGIKATNLATLGCGRRTTGNDEMPEDEDVGNAGNGIPAPLLWSVFRAEGSEETGQDHDKIGNDGHDDRATWSTGQEQEIEEKKWCRDGPINITGPVDLTEDVVVGVRDVLVLVGLDDVVVADSGTAGHGKVRDGSEDGDGGRNNVVETLALWKESVYEGALHSDGESLRVGRSMPCR